ncbi:LPS-assembly protein LptD [compost metagenome]
MPYNPGGLTLGYETEFVKFDRDLRTGDFVDENGVASPWYDTNVFGLARANGERMNLAPVMSLPMEATYGFIKPSVK